MFTTRFTSAFLAALLAAAASLSAQDAPSSPPKEIDKAVHVFNEKKYDEALKILLEADKANPNDPFVLNFIGAVYSKKKDYPAALSWFQKALDTNPDFFPARFNVGEISFLEKKYAEAYDYFSKMLERDPKNELLLFKCFLCQLLLDQMEDAGKTLKRIKYPGDTPAWYYAQAAWEIKNGRRSKADDLLEAAKYVFNKQTELYTETLQDCGMIR